MSFQTLIAALLGVVALFMLMVLLGGAPGVPEIVIFWLLVLSLVGYYFWSRRNRGSEVPR